jgi:SAM-dependent methyltransferase
MKEAVQESPGFPDEYLRCPICHGILVKETNELRCLNSSCDKHFQTINDIPILLDERKSLFSAGEVSKAESVFFPQANNSLKKVILRSIPSISKNIKARSNYAFMKQYLQDKGDVIRVLVVGSGMRGEGIDVLFGDPSFDIVQTDVSPGPGVSLICDAHDLPFQDCVFDAVIIQAVLEHVMDPCRCVEEIHRVLKYEGIVYAETPFMQQVHAGKYDFSRFTHLGHRRLFRFFEELRSGPACGPGMALAWAYQYFLLSFFESRFLRKVVRLFARCTSFYLKYFDVFLVEKVSSYEGASAFYFIGKKSDHAVSDKEILDSYRGPLDS